MIEGITPGMVTWTTHFESQVEWARVRSGPFTVTCLADTIRNPWPEEFLLRHVTLSNGVAVRWSLYRGGGMVVDCLDSLMQASDGTCFLSAVSRDLVADPQAWDWLVTHVEELFLAGRDHLDRAVAG